MKSITRREWLVEALAFGALSSAMAAAEGDEEEVNFLDLKDFKVELKGANPRVKCYDWRRLQGPVTPNADFFVFHQTTVPSVELEHWKLEIGGSVERPAIWGMQDLVRLGGAVRDLEFTLECSGNLPRPEIMNGQVGNARWSGFSLSTLLKACGVKPEAREAVFFGADQVRDSAGVAFGPHGRSAFVQDLLNSDAILATHMNGEPLPPEHGFPLRLILPGWYGMAQIKWLSRIEFLDRRYEGPHMSRNYHSLHVVPSRTEPIVVETSISKTRLKSVVARVVRRRQNGGWTYLIVGAAWGGAVAIDRVELKIDHQNWRTTRIEERRGPYSWLLWSCEVADLAPGRHSLTSRAIDAHGSVQPTADEWQRQIRSARENNSQWERAIEVPT